MANKLKKKAPPPPDPDKLKPEKEVLVTVKEVVKDERTTKIAGAVCLLVTAFLFIAFTSYLFTWQQDQDKAKQGISILVENVKVENLLGALGAYISYTFITYGFGLASYLFCTFFFVLGVNLLFDKKIFSIVRNLRYMLVGLLVFSVALHFFLNSDTFSYGGAVGELSEQWLENWIGKVGTGALLGLAVLSYIIWRFNPVFSVPKFKLPVKQNNIPDLDKEEDANDEINDDEDSMQSVPFFVKGDPGIQENKDDITNNNKLKNDGKGVVVIMPKGAEDTANPMHDFSLTEKEAAHGNIEEQIKPHP